MCLLFSRRIGSGPAAGTLLRHALLLRRVSTAAVANIPSQSRRLLCGHESGRVSSRPCSCPVPRYSLANVQAAPPPRRRRCCCCRRRRPRSDLSSARVLACACTVRTRTHVPKRTHAHTHTRTRVRACEQASVRVIGRVSLIWTTGVGRGSGDTEGEGVETRRARVWRHGGRGCGDTEVGGVVEGVVAEVFKTAVQVLSISSSGRRGCLYLRAAGSSAEGSRETCTGRGPRAGRETYTGRSAGSGCGDSGEGPCDPATRNREIPILV